MHNPFDAIPLVGRLAELSALRATLEAGARGEGRVVVLSGDGGVGKTRLALAQLAEARAAEWQVAHGRAFSAESGVPYSLFADALLPVIDQLSESGRAVVTRGAEAELLHIFPSLAKAGTRPSERAELLDLKNRLFWNFTQVLRTLSKQKPLFIVLEDLQWADASSLELLHFVARQTVDERIVFLCTYNDSLRGSNPGFDTTIKSLESAGRVQRITVMPLTLQETGEFVARTFDATPATIRSFVALLYGWTRGNPFFITEVLRALVEAGSINHDGVRWQGWEVEEVLLPSSIREAVMQRAQRLSPDAFAVAETLAAFGRQATYEALVSTSSCAEESLVASLNEMLQQQLITEHANGRTIVYDFIHPLAREAMVFQTGETRGAALHARIGRALEEHYGAESDDHADELAFHYGRARGSDEQAIRYWRVAGQRAFDAFANREAAAYWSAALDCMSDPDEHRSQVMEQLARAQQRLGSYQAAAALWQQVRADAESAGDYRRVAGVERRMGVACFWTGHLEEALTHYEAALTAALRAADSSQQVHVLIARAMCLQELGRLEQAIPDAQSALALAEHIGDNHLMGRAHRALLLLYVWNGPPALARSHGAEALRLLHDSEDPALAFSTHWAIAVTNGLTGNAPGLLEHLSRAEAIAEEVRSPVLRLWTDELAIEYGYGAGDWSAALERGEAAIALARALNQRTLLPRLLVWTALMHLGRDQMERAHSCIEEAWSLSGAAEDPARANIHAVVPAHIGRAMYHLALGEYDEAVRIGNAALAIVDRGGYTVWSLYRLLPVIGEAHLYRRDLENAKAIGDRLRRESQRMDHKLGVAWADACDALVAWLAGDARGGVVLLRAAAEQLEAIPYIPDAARVRRQLAGRLADIGERDAAIEELRLVHSMFTELGADRELAKTRDMFRELGVRLPVKQQRAGAEGLTKRELEIARLVIAGKSNKSIGKALDISVRTVSTHLSNIFGKLSVASRAELVERRTQLHGITR